MKAKKCSQIIMRKDGRFLRQVVPLCKAQVVFLTRAKLSDLTTVRKIPKIYVTLFNCSHQIYNAPKPRGLRFSLEMIFLSDSSKCLLQIPMSHFIILLYFTWKQGLIKHLWAFSPTIQFTLWISFVTIMCHNDELSFTIS